MKAFLFDLTGTLYDIDSDLEAHRQVAHWLIARYELDVTPASLHQTANRLIATYVKRLTKGEYLTGRQLMESLWRRLCTVFKLPANGLDDFIEKTREFHRRYAREVKGATELLKELKAMGFSLGLVSQIDSELMDVIVKELGFDELMDVICSAEEVGKARPDPAVIAYAVEKLGCSFEETVMVGDDIVCDVTPAKSLGLTTILLAPQGTVGAVKADYRIDTLADVSEYAKGLGEDV